MDLEEQQILYKSMMETIRKRFNNNYRKMHGEPTRRYVHLRKIWRKRWREAPVLQLRNGYAVTNGKSIVFVD